MKKIYIISGIIVGVLTVIITHVAYPEVNKPRLQISLEKIPSNETEYIADIALKGMEEHNQLSDELKGAVPGEPILVHWINHSDYYLIPFEKKGRIVVISDVFIREDGTTYFSGCGVAENITELMKPTIEEAREVLTANEYEGEWKARIVKMMCEQPINPLVWEFRNEKGDIVYVGFDPYDNKIKVYNELTPKKLRG